MEDSGYIAFYIFLTFVCMFILNYLVARDVKILFMLEKESLIQKDELQSTLNLFDGGVLIIDNESHEILFKNNQVVDLVFVKAGGTYVIADAVYKIRKIVAIGAVKDAVRLYENPQQAKIEIEQISAFVTFHVVLDECRQQKRFIAISVKDSDKIFDIRGAPRVFRNKNSTLIYIKDIT